MVQDDKEFRIEELRQRIIAERDPLRFKELVVELNAFLTEKDHAPRKSAWHSWVRQRQYSVWRVTQDNEERRLLTLAAECHAEKLAAADELSNPRRSLLYPAYMKLADALRTMKLKCHGISLAIREHRKKKRDAGSWRWPSYGASSQTELLGMFLGLRAFQLDHRIKIPTATGENYQRL
jgi:hypothetical protein